MSTKDVRGHTVPTGTDPASRQSLLSLSLSIPSIRSVASLSAATQHVNLLAAAGVVASADSPVYVMRTDLGALTWWDGTRWNLQWQRIVVVNAVTNANGIVVISYDLGGVVPSMILCTLMQGPYDSINKIATPTVHSIAATSAQVRFRREDENSWMAGQAVTFAALILR